ncbi:hypothetical protein PGTUg99_034881 [Puccinia graminis f. sp. tritici]|uniref:Uncharacterized protein n=1 Tax=Puccinia graminis f. sp. tritici TaxID=56615 RepID=A0A5B0Q9A5_PUCGR|nr:hypothetical protein PGTUg99_034881 [Puccinia graminis f. sp. tritici]
MTGSQFTCPDFPAHQGPSHLGRTSGEENRPINAPTELEADENRLRFDRSRIPVFNSEAPPNRLPPGQSPAARSDEQADATAPAFIDRNLFPRSSDYPSEQVLPSDSSSFIHPAQPSYEPTIPSARLPNFEARSDLGSNLTDIRNLPNQFEFKNPSGNPQTLPQENPFESYPARSVTNQPSNNVAANPYTHLDRSIPIKAQANQYHVADSHSIDDDSEASFDAGHGASKAHLEADRHQSEESHNSSVEDGHDELVPHAATPSITASSGGPKDKRDNEVGPQFLQEPCEDLHAGRSPHKGYLSTLTGELDRIHQQEDPLYEAELTSSMDFSDRRTEENRFDPARPQLHVQQDEHFQAGRSSTMKDNTAPRGEPEKGHRQQDQPHAGDFQVEKTTAHEIDQAPPIKKSIATFHSPTKEHNLNESSKDIFSAHLTADLDPRPEFSFSPQVTHSKINSPQSSEASLPLHSSSRGSQHENQPLSNSHQQVLPTDQAAQDRLSDNVFAGDAKISETILPNRQELSQSRSDFYHFPPYSSGLDSEASQGISNRDQEEDLSQECRSGDSATDDQDHHHRQISGPSPATEKTRRKFYFNPELAASRNVDANETTVAMNIVPPNEEVLDTEETQAALPGFELVSTLSQVMGAHTDDKTYSTQAHDRTEHISDSSSSADIPIESTVSATNQGHARSISMTQQSSSSDNQNSIIIYSDHPPTQETHDTISESPSGNSQLLEEMQGSSLDDQESHRVLDKVFDFSSTVDQRHDESSDASQSPPEQSELPIREPLRREPPANPSVLVTAEKENPEVGFFRGSTSTLSTRPYRSSSHESESEVSGEAVETLGEHLRPRHSILEPESEAAQEEASSDGEVDSHHEDNSHNRDSYELENVMDEEEFLPPGQEPTPYDMEGSEASFSDDDLDYSYTGDVPTTHLSTITELSESLAEAHLSRSPLSQNWPSQSSPAVQHESHIDEEPLGYTETHPVQLERTASLADSSLAEDVREDIPPRLEDSSQSHEITVEPDDNQSRSLQRTSNQELASSSHNSPRDIPVPQDDGSMVEHEMFGQEDSLSDVGHEHGPNTSTELDQSSYLKESELIPAAHNTESFVPPLAVPTAIPANEVQINQSTVSNNQSAAQSDFHTEAMLTVDNLVEEVLSMIPEQNNKSIVLDSPVPAETHSFDNRSIEQEESGRATPDSVLHASIREVTSDKVADSQETEAERIAHSDSAEPPSHPLKDDSLRLSVSDAQHGEAETPSNRVQRSSDATEAAETAHVSSEQPPHDHVELPILPPAALPTPEPVVVIEDKAASEVPTYQSKVTETPGHSESQPETALPIEYSDEKPPSSTIIKSSAELASDQSIPVQSERLGVLAIEREGNSPIELVAPSTGSTSEIPDQVSPLINNESDSSRPITSDEDSAGSSQLARDVPIQEDNAAIVEPENIEQLDSLQSNIPQEPVAALSPHPDTSSPPEQPESTPAIGNSESIVHPVDAADTDATQVAEAQIIDPAQSDLHPEAALLDDHSGKQEETRSTESAGPLDGNTRELVSDPVSGNHETPFQHHPETVEPPSQPPPEDSSQLVVSDEKHDEVEISRNEVRDSSDAADGPAITPVSPQEPLPDHNELPTLLSAALPTPEPAEFIEATASSEAQDVPTPAHSELPHEALIPVDILEEEVSSPTTKPLTEAVVIDQLLPVLNERPENDTTGHVEEDAIERATPSNQSTLDIVDQVSGHTEIEERLSQPSPTDEDSAGLSQVAPQNIPIPEDSTRLEEHEDIRQDDSFKDNTGHENAMITSPTTLAPTMTAPPSDGIEAMQASENDAAHPADGLVQEATSRSDRAAEPIINHEVAEAFSQSPQDNSPHLVVGNANEEKVETHSSHLSDVKDAVGDPASPTEEIPSNDLVADDPSLKSQPAQGLVATEPPSVETKNLEELTGKGMTESSEPTDESASQSLANDRLLVETEGPDRRTIEHAETEIHAVAAEQIPNSPAKVPSHSQTDDITQIVSRDPKDEMVGTSSQQSQDPSGAEELRSTTTAPPEQLQPAMSREPTVQPTLAPAAQPTPGPVDATDGTKAPGAQVLHSTISETDTVPAQPEIHTEAVLPVKSSAENAPSGSLSSELPKDQAVLDQQIPVETGSHKHHPTKPPTPLDATESIVPPVDVIDTIQSSEVEVQDNDEVSSNTEIETNSLKPIPSNGDLDGFSHVPPQDVPIPESKASVAPQDIPIPESKASMTEPEAAKQKDSLRLDLEHADTTPPSPLDESSPEGRESIPAPGSSKSVVAPVNATETTSASVAQTIQPSGDRQLQMEPESLDNHAMEQALQVPRSPEELESKTTTDVEVSRKGVSHDGTQDSESAHQSTSQDAETAPQEAEPAPQEAKPAPQESEPSPQESESAPLEAESAPQESGSAPQESKPVPEESKSAPQERKPAPQDSQPAPQEAEPAPQEPESAPQDPQPALQEAETAPQQSESAPREAEPVPQESEPAPQEPESDPQEPKSTPQDSQPASQEAETAPQPSESAPREAEPVAQESEPAPQEPETVPQESEPAPQEAETAPQESESAPQEPESAPQEAESAPQDPQPALQESETAPQESEPAPQESESAPQEADPVPQESEPAPQEPESTPHDSQPAPQEAETAPQEAETAPQESEPAPLETESSSQQSESAPQEAEPVPQESEPAPQDSQPAPQEPETAPQESEPAPQESEPAPQEAETAPPESESAPQEPESAPQEAESAPQDPQPALQESETAPQESEPAPQESEPAPQESESAPQEADPVPQESEPAPQEPESTPHDSQPAPQESEPAPQETESASQQSESAPQEAEPVPQESEPAPQEPEPAPQDSQPAPQEPETAPQESEPAPQEAETAPQESESAPQEPESAPQEAESAPQDPQPAPHESEPAYQEFESAPQEAKPVPQESELAPQEPESTSQDSQPAPQEAEAAPQESEPAPQESESAPQEAEPVPQESELAPQEPESTPQDSQPAPQEAGAAPQESKPALQESETAPQESEPAPQESEPAPQESESAPQESESAPQEADPVPQESEPAPQEPESTPPQESESAPQESEPASQEPESALREAESAPQESGPAPQESKPVPEESESASQEAESAPQEAEPAPHEPEPASQEPESAPQDPQPAPQEPESAPQDPQSALEEPESAPQESEPASQEAESTPQEAEQESKSALQEAEPSPHEPESAPQEAEPAPQESEPDPQEAESAPQDPQPALQESETAPQESEPAPQESESAPQEAEPAPQEAETAIQESKPSPQEPKSAPQEPELAPQESEPASQEPESAPQESEPAPQELESAPQEAEAVPQDHQAVPQDHQAAPQEAESAPKEAEPVPQDPQPAPQEPESAPQEAEPNPQEPESAPQQVELVPQNPQPAPQEAEPNPQEAESAPQEAESAPQEAESAPQEAKSAPQEAESAPQEAKSAPQEAESAPQEAKSARQESEPASQEAGPAPLESEPVPQEPESAEPKPAPQEAEPAPQEAEPAPQKSEPAASESEPAPQEADSAPQESESAAQESESVPQELDPTPQEPLVNAAVGTKPALAPKNLSELHLATFLSTPPVSSTSVPQPPINLSANGKAWPAAPAVSNVHREVILPARMKKISTISTSSARTLFMKDLATFAFPFSPPEPLTRKPVINSEAPTTSPTVPTSPPPRAPQTHHQNISSSPSTRAKSISSRHKLIKPYPSLKRTRATESPDHRSRRSSYRSFTFLNTIAPQATDGARGVHRTRSIKMSEFGLGHKSHKRRSARPEQNNDLGDAFAIIEMSDAMPYTPRSDRYVNPTISRRLSTSVKDILHKRNNRHNLLGKSPLDDVYLAEENLQICPNPFLKRNSKQWKLQLLALQCNERIKVASKTTMFGGVLKQIKALSQVLATIAKEKNTAG